MSLFPLLFLPLLLLLVSSGAVSGEEDRVTTLEKLVVKLSHQVMSQQLLLEETSRSNTDSGIKLIRRRGSGPKSYSTETHSGFTIASFHNHANNVRTVGLGDFVAVLNGVEFRTRHNDYPLLMPSRSDGRYHASQDVPYPGVPPEVTQKSTVQEQIDEMREWFKAWKDQNSTVRDYRQYFKPILCYLEGAWTTDEHLNGLFGSDRHFLDAESRLQSMAQIRFTAFTGSKNFQENYSFLPTTILNATNGTAQYAFWHYHILCHPLEGDLPLSALKPVDYLASRLPRKRTYNEHVESRAVRFRLESPSDTESWTLQDELMHQIPGKDNYGANLTDDLFEMVKMHVVTGEDLNAGYYHSSYKVSKKDAMGDKVLYRGYSDKNLYVALTTQPNVTNMTIPFRCRKGQIAKGWCKIYTHRVSYAIPLEIIYLTPLHTWNPYDLEYKGDFHSDAGQMVRADGRDGTTEASAYNGTNSKMFFRTPVEFFSGYEVGSDPADTTKARVFALDRNGTARVTSSSGVRIILPNIPGVGVLRTRYPIMPLATEGNPIKKELDALSDMFMDMKNHLLYFPTSPPFPEQVLQVHSPWATHSHLYLSDSDGVHQTSHRHTVNLSKTNYDGLRKGNKTLYLYTTVDMGHHHELVVDYNESSRKFEVQFCDKNPKCFDQHPKIMVYKKLKGQ